jgi:integrase
LVFLRGIFERLKKRAGMTENPFGEIPLLDLKEVGRIAFSLEELDAIVIAARKPEHAFIRPVISIGICTAMRRGDCCTLKWEDIEMDAGFIEVTNAKIGKKVSIPLFLSGVG